MERYSTAETAWLPGRVKHVFNAFSKASGLDCSICNGIKQIRERQNYLLHSSKHCIVTHSPTPYCIGHLLVIPTRHVCYLKDFLDCEILDLFRAQQISQEILAETVHPHSYDMGISAGIINTEFSLRHIVYHIVPRKKGDKNLMLSVTSARELRMIVNDACNSLQREFDNRTLV